MIKTLPETVPQPIVLVEDKPVKDKPPIIELENVSIGFDGQQVLRNVSFTIHEHETVAIIGQSGCGKSVTLKLIVGLLQPDAGRVLYQQQPISELSNLEMTRMRQEVGFLFQQSALFDSLTVGENISFGLRARGERSEERLTRQVEERLRDVGLPDVQKVASQMPAELSGGMRKRIGLARALALDPKVMLYDEPTTGLDPIMTKLINDLIEETSDRDPQITSLIVTHEMRTVMQVAKRVIMFYPLAQLNSGEPQIIYDGHPTHLRDFPDDRVRNFVQ